MVFLRELSSILSAQIFEKLIYRVYFSEWGALLLYQEVFIHICIRNNCMLNFLCGGAAFNNTM